MNIDIQDPNKLVSDGNEMSEQARQFKEEVKRIYEITDDLKNSWVGQSSQRFTDNINKYKNGIMISENLIKNKGFKSVNGNYQGDFVIVKKSFFEKFFSK